MRLSKLEVIVRPGLGVLAALVVAGCSTSGTSAAPPSIPSIGGSGTPSASPTGSSAAPASSAEPPASATGQPAPSDAASPNDCKASELRLSLGHGEGAAGTVYRPLRFTNVGARTCTIQGFPGVSYVAGADSHQVGSAAFREGTKGPAIQLSPGGTVNAPVGFTQVGNFDPNACKPTPVTGIRVYPPHDTASVIVAMGGTGCAGTPPGNQLVVRTVQIGSGV
jgi:hypothetical protein